MPTLATELPVKTSISKFDFFAQAIAWVKGIKGSQLFVNGEAIDLDSNTALVTSENGESLTLKNIAYMDGFVAGARHEILDNEGRLWRSEVVLTSHSGKAAIRSKTQCIADSAVARMQLPQKPFFIKMAIDDAWVEKDFKLDIDIQANHLAEADIELAADIINGKLESTLPICYFSRNDDDSLIIEDRLLSRFALKMAGIAHVVIEPSRRFSIKLQHSTNRKNPYSGTAAVCMYGYGVLKKHYTKGTEYSGAEILEEIYSYAAAIATNRKPIFGLDWADIPEYITDALRNEIKNGSSELSSWLDSQEAILKEKELQISELQNRNEALQKRLLKEDSEKGGILEEGLATSIGKEIYDGEFHDRARYVFGIISTIAIDGLDERTREFSKIIYGNTKFSGGASHVITRINQSGKDSKTADRRLGEILQEIGFTKRLDGGHPVYNPADLFGVEQQTLSTSPSDHRSGRNSASRIANALNIKKLS